MKARKQQPAGDTHCEANRREVTELRTEHTQLKRQAAEILLKNKVLKKSLLASGSTRDDEVSLAAELLGYLHAMRVINRSTPTPLCLDAFRQNQRPKRHIEIR